MINFEVLRWKFVSLKSVIESYENVRIIIILKEFVLKLVNEVINR